MSSLQRREEFLASNLFRCYASNIFSEISQFNFARSITLKMGEIESFIQFQLLQFSISQSMIL